MGFDGGRAREDAERIAFPRRSGTEGSQRALESIIERLRSAGLEPVVETFRFSPLLMERALPLALLAVAGTVLAATYTYPASPPTSVALLLLGFLGGLPATRWSRGVERLLDLGDRREAANVVAHLPAPPDADRHLILMAHHDSKSQRLPMQARIATVIAVLGGGAVLLGSAAIGVAAGRLLVPPGVAILAGSLSAVGILLLAANRSGNASPGALDNATGVGTLLELARNLAASPPRRTRVTLVATGAEEEGLAGAVRFLQAHGPELGPNPFVLNLDSLGAGGRVAVLSRFGIPPMGAGAGLARLAVETAAGEGIRVKRTYLPAGAATDHFPAAYRGIPSITLATLGRGLRRIHTPADDASRVSWEGLDAAGRLALALIRRVDDPEQLLS